MKLEEAVLKDPEIMSGELCFTGTRVPVANLFGYLKGGSTLDDFLDSFPTVIREQAETVLAASLEELERKPMLPKSA